MSTHPGFSFQPGTAEGDPGKRDYLHNPDWQGKPFSKVERIDPRACPGCIYPQEPHTNDLRCEAWKKRCCCSHGAEIHWEGGCKCTAPGCDCFNFCDCHVIAAEMRDDSEEGVICKT